MRLGDLVHQSPVQTSLRQMLKFLLYIKRHFTNLPQNITPPPTRPNNLVSYRSGCEELVLFKTYSKIIIFWQTYRRPQLSISWEISEERIFLTFWVTLQIYSDRSADIAFIKRRTSVEFSELTKNFISTVTRCNFTFSSESVPCLPNYLLKSRYGKLRTIGDQLKGCVLHNKT